MISREVLGRWIEKPPGGDIEGSRRTLANKSHIELSRRGWDPVFSQDNMADPRNVYGISLEEEVIKGIGYSRFGWYREGRLSVNASADSRVGLEAIRRKFQLWTPDRLPSDKYWGWKYIEMEG